MSKSKCLSFLLSVVVLAVFFVPSALMAQSTTSGAIAGTIYDPTGAVVPNATITVRNTGTNAEQTATSDNAGYYRIGSLQPAPYAITVAATGFANKTGQIVVQVGTLSEFSPRLAVGKTAESVSVTSEAPQINTTSADFAPVVDQTAISNLPINGGRWSNFALLTPTAVSNGDGFGLISFRGMSVLLNNNTIDGADNNQAFFAEERGRTRMGYSTSKSAVQEFQVNTSNYSAEYGRSAGGVINTVTKSGTNSFHGEGYFYDRDNSWGAFNPFTTIFTQSSPGVYTSHPYKPTDVRKMSGFAIGGPILKDKLFFFLGLDWFKRVFPGTAIPSAPNTFFKAPSAANINTLASRLGVTSAVALNDYNTAMGGLLSIMGPVPRTGQQWIVFPKIDWQINGKNHLTLSANRARWASPAGIQTQATNNYGAASFGNDYVKTTWGVARLDTLITNHIANQFRFQYGRDFEYQNPQTPTPYEMSTLINPPGYTNPLGYPPNVYLSQSGSTFQYGVATFLTRPKYPDELRQQYADTLTWNKGNHTFKLGFDISHVNDTSQNLRNQFGAYNYYGSSSVTNLIDYTTDLFHQAGVGTWCSGKPCYSSYQQGWGPMGYQFTTNDFAFFAQDDWRIMPRLTLSLGLRYEYEQLPSPIASLVNPAVPQTGKFPADKNNLGPRFGFAWDIFGDGKSSLRGGYGMYYGRVINSTIYNALMTTGMPGGQSQYTFYPGVGSPTFPQILPVSGPPTAGSSAKPTAIYFDPNFQLPQVHQVDLTFEQDLGWNTVMSLAYLGSFGHQLPGFVDTNLATPTKNINYKVVGGPLADLVGSTYSIPLYTAWANPAYNSITDVFSGINSNYNAMVFQVNHRMSRHVQFSTNLTWSRALDYAQNQQTFTDVNDFLVPGNLKIAYGKSQYDIPLRFVLNAVAQSPWHKSGWAGLLANGWQIAPLYQWQMGMVYSLAPSGSGSGGVNSGLNGTGTGTGYTFAQGNFSGYSYIPAIGRNTERGPGTYVIDLKLSKSFTYKDRYTVEFSGEGFNLFNHQNVTGINSTGYNVSNPTVGGVVTPTLTYNSGFGTITNSNSNYTFSPRQVQLGVRLKF